jgi:hypothetical protein
MINLKISAMKKLVFFKIYILMAFFPICLQAQIFQLPAVEIRVSQDKVPPALKAAVIRDFGEGHQPMAWVTTGTNFDTYEWAQTVNVDKMDILYYMFRTHTSAGSELFAVYTLEGKLIRSSEEVRNIEPPRVILASFEKSNYRDWKIINDLHVVKVNERGRTKEHYDLKVEKGNHTKTLYFDKNGKIEITRSLFA